MNTSYDVTIFQHRHLFTGNLSMATFRVTNTDLTKEEAAFIVAAATLIWEKLPTDGDVRQLLADRLKVVLDMKFSPSWHILCGADMGFALKSRRKSSVVLSGPRHIQIVCWRSPGHEIISADAVRIMAERKLREANVVIPPLSKAIKVIQQPRLGDVDFSGDFSEAIKAIDDLITSDDITDIQVLAQSIRTRLTAIVGPVWHVILGSDFRLASPSGLSHQILIKKGKIRIHCFKHTEMSTSNNVWAALLSSWRSILVILACVAFMLHSRLCTSETRHALCPADGSQMPTYMATVFIGLIVVQQIIRLVNKKK